MSMDHSLLLQLPEDDTVIDEIETTQLPDQTTYPEGPDLADDMGPTTGTVPETRAYAPEIEALRTGSIFFPN